MRPIELRLTAVDDTQAIASNQSIPGSGGDLVLNGNLVDNRNIARTGSEAFVTVTIASTQNLSGRNFTVTGRTPERQVESETLAGPTGGSSVNTTKLFNEVYGVSVDGSINNNVQVGFATTGIGMSSALVPVNWRQSPFNMSLGALYFAGTSALTAVYYLDKDFTEQYAITGLDGVTVTSRSNLNFPVRYVKFELPGGDAADDWLVTIIQGQNG